MSPIARPPAITADFDRLAARLHEIVQGRPILFVITSGNWGDSLIRQGSEEFLRHHGFHHHAVAVADLTRGRTRIEEAIATAGSGAVMVVCGGGSFTGRYRMPSHLAGLSHRFETSVILPSTYAMDMGVLGFSAGTVFFRRDQVESAQRMPGAMFCHDLAFFLQPEKVGPGAGEGWFLREDRERPPGLPLHRANFDLSMKGRSQTPVEGFFRHLAPLRTIHTNRLHVGIAAAILGKDVRLYSNDHFKIRAVFEASLAPHYPNVTFAPEPVLAEGERLRWYHRILRRRRGA